MAGGYPPCFRQGWEKRGHSRASSSYLLPSALRRKKREGPVLFPDGVGSQRFLSSCSCPCLTKFPGYSRLHSPQVGKRRSPSAPEFMSSFHFIYKFVFECVLTSS